MDEVGGASSRGQEGRRCQLNCTPDTNQVGICISVALCINDTVKNTQKAMPYTMSHRDICSEGCSYYIYFPSLV